MAEKGVIRRVIRGLYDYPAYSNLLKKSLSPDVNQVAYALVRKFGWQIQISGNEELQKLRSYLLDASGAKVEFDNESLVLPKTLIDRTLKDTQYVTSWVACNIRRVVLGANG